MNRSFSLELLLRDMEPGKAEHVAAVVVVCVPETGVDVLLVEVTKVVVVAAVVADDACPLGMH